MGGKSQKRTWSAVEIEKRLKEASKPTSKGLAGAFTDEKPKKGGDD